MFFGYISTKLCLKKCLKSALDVEFLINCKTNEFFPKFLSFKLYKKCLQNAAFYKYWQTKLLARKIQFKRKAEKSLSTEVILIENEIRTKFSSFDAAAVFRHFGKIIDDFKLANVSTHRRKLYSLVIDSTLKPMNPNKVISNYSSVVVPPRVKYLLAFGL